MRKITLLFSIVCAFVLCATVSADDVLITDISQLTNENVYTIATGDNVRGGLIVRDGDTSIKGSKNSDSGININYDSTDPQQQFAILKSTDNKHYLYSIKENKFVNKNGELQEYASDPITITNEGNNKANTFFFTWASNNNLNLGGANQIVINGYSTRDAGNQFSITQVENVSFSGNLQTAAIKKITPQIITVNFKVGEELKAQSSLKGLLNQTIKVGRFSYVTTTPSEITITEGVNSVDITCTANTVPEELNNIISDVDNVDDCKWFSLFTYNGRMHMYDEATYNRFGKYSTTDKATFTRLEDKYFWALYRPGKSQFSPIYIVNKAEKDKVLYLTTNNDDAPVILGSKEDGYSAEWIIETGKTKNGEQYYGLCANRSSEYINNYQNKGFLTTWHQGTSEDNGSNIKFTSELDTYEILKERALNAPCNAVHSLNPKARKAIKDLPAEKKNIAGYQELIKFINQEDTPEGFIEFDENKYYFIRNYTPENPSASLNGDAATYILTTEDGSAVKLGVINTPGDADNIMTCSDANAIWQITDNGANEEFESRAHARRINHLNSGKQFTDRNTRTLDADGADYYFVELGAGQHFMKNVKYQGTGAQSSSTTLSGYRYDAWGNIQEVTLSNSANAHYKNTRDAWYVIEASSLNISLNPGNDGKNYATACFPFAISIPEKAKMTAYTVESINSESGHLNLEPVAAGETIPAGTGLILIGDKQASTVDIIAGSTETAEADPILKGVNMAVTFGSTITKDAVLVLGQDTNGNVGFYKPSDAMTGLRSNSAYILVSALNGGNPVNGLKFNFGGIANGIDGVSTDSNNGQVIYDLQGRRVNKLSKGLYIVNGKKVIR